MNLAGKLNTGDWTVITDRFEGNVGLDERCNAGNVHGVLKGVLGALLQRALDHLAAVRLDVGHADVEAVQAGHHDHLDLVRVLVGDEFGGKVQWFALVEDAVVAGAAVNVDLEYLMVGCGGGGEGYRKGKGIS